MIRTKADAKKFTEGIKANDSFEFYDSEVRHNMSVGWAITRITKLDSDEYTICAHWANGGHDAAATWLTKDEAIEFVWRHRKDINAMLRELDENALMSC